MIELSRLLALAVTYTSVAPPCNRKGSGSFSLMPKMYLTPFPEDFLEEHVAEVQGYETNWNRNPIERFQPARHIDFASYVEHRSQKD
ncbi:hypothetical protein [Pseudoxanthomonas suwonensis]|uniref:hypothetical protein n=2 Tax=Pseudoxanthomonas TaxID=83618 RepID=UPI0012DDBB3B|nr:hypothetical protein [Pseudoxanthomonas suwonensis]